MQYTCEVFLGGIKGHCQWGGFKVAFVDTSGHRVRLILCVRHAQTVFKDWQRMPVQDYAEAFGLVQDEPIIGARLAPAYRKSDYLAKPDVWGDERGHYASVSVPVEFVQPGHLYVFANDHGHAYRVNSIDVCPMPYGPDMFRFNCTGGATAGAFPGSMVEILMPEGEEHGK